ncbi:MAG: hypothetical protein ACOYEV_17330 [Candidatus Nanopelagicales bacterium]
MKVISTAWQGLIGQRPAVLGLLLIALGLLLLAWSAKPLTSGPNSRPATRSKPYRWLDVRLNRPWQAAIPVTFAVATALISLALGTAVDRFAPAEAVEGHYIQVLWIVSGLATLFLGLGAAFWRGRVNQEQGFGTAIIIDERLEGFSPTEHEQFDDMVRRTFHSRVTIPPLNRDQPAWRLTGQNWDDRIDRLVQNLLLVRQLDRADTPTSLFVKAPWQSRWRWATDCEEPAAPTRPSVCAGSLRTVSRPPCH